MMKDKKEKQNRRIFGRSLPFVMLFVAWVGNAILRVLFGHMAASGVQLLDTPVAQSTSNIITVTFLFLGLTGLIVSFGLWQMRRWGFLGVIIVILGTIIFDIWGMTIQYTAAMGFVVPVVVLIYLVLNRSLFFRGSRSFSPASRALLK